MTRTEPNTLSAQEKARICAALAEKMLPKAKIEQSQFGNGVDIRIYDKPNETRSCSNFDPFTSDTDCRALVEWIKNSLPFETQAKFLNHLLFAVNRRTDKETLELMIRKENAEMNAGIKRDLALLTAPRPIIVQAACAALGIPWEAQPPATAPLPLPAPVPRRE